MNLWAVLLTGLFAGGASCAAVQGGLLAGTLARRKSDVTASSRKAKASNDPVAAAPLSARMDHVAPVGGFLAGKLASHLALGAVLGLVGDAAQVGPRVRAWTQILAGIVMVLLALNLLGVTRCGGWFRLRRRDGRDWCGAVAGGAEASGRPFSARPPCSFPVGSPSA